VPDEEIKGKVIIVKLVPEGNIFRPDNDAKMYTADGKELSEDARNSVLEYMQLKQINRIKELSKDVLENPIKNPQNLKVKFFEKAPFKGLPSEVPFDIEKGWYAEMTFILSGFGQPYDKSGRVVNFYVCNVGENGLIEFKKGGDDICRYYNLDTGASVNFPGLSVSESRRVITLAQRSINEAARQFGNQRITVNGHTFYLYH